MAGIFGRKGKIVVGTTGVVAEVTDWSLDESGDTVEDTAMDATSLSKTFITGNTEWQGQITCNYARSDADGQAVMRAGQSMAAKLYPEGSAVGKQYWSGTVLITKFGASSNVNGKIVATFAVKGTGDLTEATA